MTSGQRFLVKLVLSAGALAGAAYGGGQYLYKQKLDECQAARVAQGKSALALRSRALLMEAEIGVLRNNFAFAFDRMAQAGMAAEGAGLKLKRDFDELQGLMLTQNPATGDRIVQLADKVIGAEEPKAQQRKPLPANSKPAPAARPEAKSEARPEAPAPASPAPARAELAPDAAPKAPAQAARPEEPALPAPTGQSADIPVARKLLLEVKVAVLASGLGTSSGSAPLLQKLAQARVLLDEAGHDDLDGELDAVMEGVRRRDENKVKTNLDGILKKTRAP